MTTGHPKDSDYIKQPTSIEEAAEQAWDVDAKIRRPEPCNPHAYKAGFIEGAKSEAAKEYWFEQLQPFLKWVFLKADRIYVEHTLGWRDEAIKELYEVYLKQEKK